jgi:hypothetical protein
MEWLRPGVISWDEGVKSEKNKGGCGQEWSVRIESGGNGHGSYLEIAGVDGWAQWWCRGRTQDGEMSINMQERGMANGLIILECGAVQSAQSLKRQQPGVHLWVIGTSITREQSEYTQNGNNSCKACGKQETEIQEIIASYMA